MPLRIETHADGHIIALKVVPNASRDQIVGLLGDALKVKVAKPPEKGAANAAVEALLARTLGVAPKQVQVIAGHTQPLKRVKIEGVSANTIAALAEKKSTG